MHSAITTPPENRLSSSPVFFCGNPWISICFDARSPFSLSLSLFLFHLLKNLPHLRGTPSSPYDPLRPLQVPHLQLEGPAPVLQLYFAPPGCGIEARHDAPLPVQLGLGFEAMQLDASADGNGRVRGGRGGGW